jgi:large subunit ribosomal protein L22
MEHVAYIKYSKISPKKIRELAHAVVGLSALTALDRLTLLTDHASGHLSKAIKSALSNAVHNGKLVAESVKIKSIEIGKGPFLKRWNPVSKGMAHSIKKRTSHIRVTVESVQPAKAKAALPGKNVEQGKTIKAPAPVKTSTDKQNKNEKLEQEKGK